MREEKLLFGITPSISTLSQWQRKIMSRWPVSRKIFSKMII